MGKVRDHMSGVIDVIIGHGFERMLESGLCKRWNHFY